MVANLERLEEGPYELEAWLQTWGGKQKGKGKGKGSGYGSTPGRIDYHPIDAGQFRQAAIGAVSRAAESLGYRLVKE